MYSSNGRREGDADEAEVNATHSLSAGKIKGG
jgi:hypothetical protein